jgi:hypothetical protein
MAMVVTAATKDSLVDSEQALGEAMEATGTEDSLVDSEQALDETMEVIEAMAATAMDSGVLAVALAVTREVGYSSAKGSHTMVNTNNKVGAATSSRVAAALVVVAEAHVSVP